MDKLQVPQCICPHCNYKMDTVSDVESAITNTPMKRGPMEGDVALCFSCTQPLIYRADLTIRAATCQEENDINREPSVKAARRALHKIDRRHLNGA